MDAEESLSVIVDKHDTEIALGSLRAEGVYDDSRSLYECDGDTVAIPVDRPPEETSVIEVVRETGEPRLQTLEDHLAERGWSEVERERAPASWAVIGSVILVDVSDSPRPAEVGEALLAMHGNADTVLARGGITGPHREPSGEVIAGEGDTETVHREHGVEYAMDLATVMFSPGNKAERQRMGDAVDDGERVLDMFAGIGYFTLPMAIGGASVTAIERNPASFQYLIENVVRNGVQDRVETYRGDCREVVDGIFEGGGQLDSGADDADRYDRVMMGYYDAHDYLDSAMRAVGPDGIIHFHAVTPEACLPDRPVDRLTAAAERAGRSVEVMDNRRVKTFSEGVSHVVVDARIRDST